MARQCIAVFHPLCALRYYFLKYQPNTHQTIRAEMHPGPGRR